MGWWMLNNGMVNGMVKWPEIAKNLRFWGLKTSLSRPLTCSRIARWPAQFRGNPYGYVSKLVYLLDLQMAGGLSDLKLLKPSKFFGWRYYFEAYSSYHYIIVYINYSNLPWKCIKYFWSASSLDHTYSVLRFKTSSSSPAVSTNIRGEKLSKNPFGSSKRRLNVFLRSTPWGWCTGSYHWQSAKMLICHQK